MILIQQLILLFINLSYCSCLHITNEALSKRITELENRQRLFETEMEQKMGEMEHGKRENRMLLQNTSCGIRNQRVGEGVAFSTLLSYVQTNIALGQTIKFDRVLLNDGSGYSTNSGVFTVPVSGVYQFSYFIAVGGGDERQTWMELMHNGNKVNGAATDSMHNWQDLQGGNVAIVSAQAKDELWIQCFHTDDAGLYGDNGLTSFSGVLLY